jgi:hypothetical protein
MGEFRNDIEVDCNEDRSNEDEVRDTEDIEDEQGDIISKSSVIGAFGPFRCVTPAGDHRPREGIPPDRAQPRCEDGGTQSAYEDLIMRVARIARERSTPSSRPPGPVHISDQVPDSAPCSDMHGPLHDQLARMERGFAQMKEALFKQASMRKRARKARKRREKQRQFQAAASIGASPESLVSAEITHPIVGTWVPPEQAGEIARCVVGSDSEAGVGCAPPTGEVKGILPPIHDWVPPGVSTSDADTQTSNPAEVESLGFPPSTEAEQTITEQTRSAPTKAQIRRDHYPPRPLSPEVQLARMRRAEKKILNDQIRARNQANGRSGPTAGNRHAEGPVGAGGPRPRQSEEATL